MKPLLVLLAFGAGIAALYLMGSRYRREHWRHWPEDTDGHRRYFYQAGHTRADLRHTTPCRARRTAFKY